MALDRFRMSGTGFQMLPGSQSTYNTRNQATKKSTWRATPVRQWVGDPRLPVRRAEQTNMDDRQPAVSPIRVRETTLQLTYFFPSQMHTGNYLTTILSIFYSAILIPLFWL